jgi:hypothetical protein
MSNTITDDLPTEIDLMSLLNGKSETKPPNKTSENTPPKPSIANDTYLECEKSSNIYSNKCNSQLLKFEKEQGEYLNENEITNTSYPLLDDPNFNMKITRKKEFSDMGYNGVIYRDVKKHADQLLKERFELSPHQIFVKNFLSLQTPYNSLLLYHGLGTGKTCSAIGICEEMRKYMSHIGKIKKMIIVASPNVQDNFRLQLFDETKLKLVDGKWDIQACLGTSIINELNPTIFEGVVGMSRERLIQSIKSLIDGSYLFLGYIQFANLIDNVTHGNIKSIDDYTDTIESSKLEYDKTSKSKKNVSNELVKTRLTAIFSHRLIVIDEIHNIRYSNENTNKIVAENFTKLITVVPNMRLILMTATPMYNNYKEIIWLLNVMNINDRRGVVKLSDVFDEDGNFLVNDNGENIGKDLFIRKMNGYVSFVRGENPYTFPYRIYPDKFSLLNTLQNISCPNGTIPIPSRKINGKIILDNEKMNYLIPYISKMNNYQQKGYELIINKISNTNNFKNMNTFGYKLLLTLIYATNIIYPCQELDDIFEGDDISVVSDLDNVDDDLESVNMEDFDTELGGSKIKNSSIRDNDSQDEFSVEDIEDDNKEEDNDEADAEDNKEEDNEESDEDDDEDDEDDEDDDEDDEDDEDDDEDDEDDDEEADGPRMRVKWNTNKIIGTDGLRNVMNYIDTMKPPIRGDFEYKPNILEKYGRIFDKNNINKYSCKIDTVLNNIFTPNGFCEGIVLIYSQYINAGIIPMSLALEERGITRFGDTNKNLFKIKPCEDIDSITGLPLRDMVENRSDFQPATYIIISGDIRLSKNNEQELKECTKSQNVNGKNIKVILITRTGSEGIDFKNIRQVHILDPWYNMNRNEQIIGRAVRNFSHRDLEFEKRNVMLFLHATMLNDTDEETSDMYMYRISELKSIIMGKISRVMKENAIDCNINSQQKNFTQSIMSKYLTVPITQILSDGIVLDDYKVGDVPYSSICDYMEKCSYKCTPNNIPKNLFGSDTTSYGKLYVETNMMRLVPKIKDLFKIRFFYKKGDIVRILNYSKKYPIEEINYALTYIVKDDVSYVYDPYQRIGKIINILDYYLFQPIELIDTSSSLFEKSKPVDYKHDKIKVMFQNNFEDKSRQSIYSETKQPKQTDKEDIDNFQKEYNFKLGKNIFDRIEKNYISTIQYIENKSLSLKGVKDYYKHSGFIIRYLSGDLGLDLEILIEYSVIHNIDELNKEDKLELLNYIINEPNRDDKLFFIVKLFFEKNYLDYHGTNVIQLGNNIYIQNGSLFEVASDIISLEIYEMLEEAIKPYVENYPNNTVNTIIGFIDYENKLNTLLFKLRDTSKEQLRKKSDKIDKRIMNTHGFVASTTGKAKAIEILNVIVNTKPKEVNMNVEKYTKENSKMFIELDICIIQEFLLRYYQDVSSNDILYFYSYEKKVIMGRLNE